MKKIIIGVLFLISALCFVRYWQKSKEELAYSKKSQQ